MGIGAAADILSDRRLDICILCRQIVEAFRRMRDLVEDDDADLHLCACVFHLCLQIQQHVKGVLLNLCACGFIEHKYHVGDKRHLLGGQRQSHVRFKIRRQFGRGL